VNKSIKTLLLSGFFFAFAQTADAIPVTYSVSGSTYEIDTGREIAITGSLTFESESTSSGLTPHGYTGYRHWSILSGSLSSDDFNLHEITGDFNYWSGSYGTPIDFHFFLREGSDVRFENRTSTSLILFYDVDGNPLNSGVGAVDNDYSQLAPLIQLRNVVGRANGEVIYGDEHWWLTQVPIPPAAWLFSFALGLMGVMRRKLAS
jgi:hypothetical protein